MNRINLYLFLVLLLVSLLESHGQGNKNKVSISKELDRIANAESITFNYESSLLKNIRINPVSNKTTLTTKLKNLERQTGLIFTKISDAVYSITKAIKICGYIVGSEFQNPLAGATINSKSAYAITDEKGFFEISLRSLDALVSIRHIGYKSIERQAKYFNLKECADITLLFQQETISPVLIESYLVRGIDKRNDWSTSIDYHRFSLLPGLIESDILQTVQALPSILSVDETVSNINIRGGSHDQNLILWDDIKMYQTGHFFGLISSFNPLMTQTADVINNGSQADLTDGVSGTIYIQTGKQIDSEFNNIFGINFLNAELFSNIPINNKSSIQVAARKSIDDLVRTPTYTVYFDRITQDTEAENSFSNLNDTNQDFNFYDASLRWLYKPSDKDEFRLNFIVINNNLGFDETALINDITTVRRSSLSQNSIAGGFNYKRHWNTKFQTNLNIYESDYKLQSLNANILSNQLFLQENVVSETSIKLNNSYKTNLWRYNFGYHFVETEIINLNDIDLPRFVRRDEEVLREHAAFGQVQFTNSSQNFSIRGGLRANYLTKFEKFIIEPRLSVRKSIGNFHLEALGEFKHQSTSQIINFQNDFLGIEKRRWQLTDNDSIPVIESKQASVGLSYKKAGWLIDTKVFYKAVDGITSQSQSFTTKYEFAKVKGSYDVYGLELLFRKEFGNFNNWISFSLMDNTYYFDSLIESSFPSNFDVPYSLTFGSTFSNKSWKISAGLNYRTGKPTSKPLKGSEIRNNQINFDRANKERLLDYLRIDASALYKFKMSKKLRSEIGASIWNITNRENTTNNYYRINETEAIDKFSRFSLRLTTNAVLRIFF